MSQPMLVTSTAPGSGSDPRWYSSIQLMLVKLMLTLRLRVYLDNVRRNPGPFTGDEFNPTEEGLSTLGRMKILLVKLRFQNGSNANYR